MVKFSIVLPAVFGLQMRIMPNYANESVKLLADENKIKYKVV